MNKLVVVFSLCVVAILIGCGGESTPPVVSDMSAPVAQQVSDEMQAVVDQYVLPDGASQLASSPFGPSWDPGPNCDVYAITFLWGSLCSVAPASDIVTNWSGGLRTSTASGMRVRTTIDFEEGEDYLEPAVDVASIRWVSFTSGDFDGISVLIYLRTDITVAVIPTLSFDTEAIELYWDFSELVKLDAYYPIANAGGVIVHSRRLSVPLCPRGYLEGKWIKDNGSFTQKGRFEGIWTDHLGHPTGYVSGEYWPSENQYGGGELEGWVSGFYTDEIIARLKGVWYYDDPRMCPVCGEGHGQFKGRIYMQNDGTVGSFRGEFGDWSLPPDDSVMPFKGSWKLDCVDQPQDEVGTHN